MFESFYTMTEPEPTMHDHTMSTLAHEPKGSNLQCWHLFSKNFGRNYKKEEDRHCLLGVCPGTQQSETRGKKCPCHCRNPRAAQLHRKLSEELEVTGAELSQHPAAVSTGAFALAGIKFSIQGWAALGSGAQVAQMSICNSEELSNSFHTRRFSDDSIPLIHCTLRFPGKSAALYTYFSYRITKRSFLLPLTTKYQFIHSLILFTNNKIQTKPQEKVIKK